MKSANPVHLNKGDRIIANKSTTYILPMLDGLQCSIVMATKVNTKGIPYLINCFVKDDGRPDLKNHIFLLYEKPIGQLFEQLDSHLKHCKHFLENYTVDEGYEMYAFRVPGKYQTEYDNFLLGKYSRFSDSYKQKIMSYHSLSEGGPVYNVLYKAESKYLELEERYKIKIPRSQENSSKPYMDTPKGFKNNEISVECFRKWMRNSLMAKINTTNEN